MLDIEYIKDKVELTSIARQIVYTEILQEGMPARYNTSSKFIYIDSKFKVHSVSFKNINSIVVPTTDVSVKYEFDLDVIDFFNSTEELMLMSLLDSLGDSKIPTMGLIECIDYCKKQIYRANLKPANVLVSKTTFNALVNKLYLLPYAKVFTLPTKNISYDNLYIFPIDIKNDNIIITFAEPYQVGNLIIRNKPYAVNGNVIENVGMFISNEESISFSYVNSNDMNRILSNSGGYCKRCKMFDEYAPLDDSGGCLCYKCYNPYC